MGSRPGEVHFNRLPIRGMLSAPRSRRPLARRAPRGGKQKLMEASMTRIDDRINRRTALVQLTAATMLAGGAARAQRADLSLARINTTDLGRKTYMLEGQGGNILVVIGDDGIIMVDAELAPLHDKIKAAITASSSLPIKYLVDTH